MGIGVTMSLGLLV